jgi:ABC-type transport system substrate-binding protein
MKSKTGRFWRLWAAVMGGAFVLGISVAMAASPQGVLKQGIHWGLSADWLDPATASYVTTANHPLYLFHDALLKAMPDGNYTPCLAESWTISPDFKVYEFKLRKGVKFHNGDTLTAEERKKWRQSTPSSSGFNSRNPSPIFWIIFFPERPPSAG